MRAIDAVERRAIAIEGLLSTMELSKAGWPKQQITEFLCKRYSFGLSVRGAERILGDLVELRRVYIKGNRYYAKKTTQDQE